MESKSQIKEDNIKNEQNLLVDYDSLKKIINLGLEKCICKIKIEIKE